MDIKKSFDKALDRMRRRNWEKIYILVDIHDTIFEACYHDEETYKWFPYAKEALQIMSYARNMCLILWSSSHSEVLKELYGKVFEENHIKFDYININPETKNNDLSCFDEKTYFNVGIDDKFGFDAETDWETVHDYLVEAIRLGKFK
jgi:hypothetical protein